ncbi:kinase-like domain-containing protein [Obelidium mucronatum]|nr:kinase-like domain-containing protein [Obelidium mucronatum]
MNLEDLSAACPGVDFAVPYKHSSSFSIGDYVIKNLQKTLDIIKSSIVENELIVDFVKAGIKDQHLPLSEACLIQNLKYSYPEANDFLLAQSAFFAVSLEPQEFRILGPLDFIPFVVDSHTNLRAGGYGMVEKVFEGDNSYARKTISDNFNVGKIMMEIKILRLATDTRNPHLLHLRCAYQQENRTCLVMHPWCELDLNTFLERSHEMPWWTQRTSKEKLILITDWMACLASGLCALHKKNIKHQDIKPENVLLDADLLPVICDFGLSKAFDTDSKSVKVQGTRAYLPPEQFDGKVGRKGDIFSLGLVFMEIALLFFGQKSLKEEFASGFYADLFQRLVQSMLSGAPENRSKASEVWETAKGMVESLGAKPHCTSVSPVGSIPCDDNELEDYAELYLRENLAKIMDKEECELVINRQ